MNKLPPAEEAALRRLVENVVNGQATDIEFLKLSETLESNPHARAFYIEYTAIHAELTNQKLARIDEDTGEAASRDVDLDAPVTRSPNLQTMWPIALATLILIASLMIPLIRGNAASDETSQSTTDLTQSPWDRADQAVAVLSQSVDVAWTNSSFAIGAPLEPGLLEFNSGLIKIEFYCGASLILEGPARFEVLNANRGFLHSGRLRAYVPYRARGFQVGSQHCQVEDLGTEFAMDVGLGGSEVHVLDGEVRVMNPEGKHAELLTTGDGIQRTANGNRLAIEADQDKFVGPNKLSMLSQQSTLHGFENWLSFLQKARTDDSCIALYTFQESHAWDRTLINSAPHAGEESHGAIVGCEWENGRWEGQKRALRFTSSSHRVRINVPGKFNNITLSTWVKLESLAKHPTALTHPETDQPNFIHWTIDPSGELGLLHFSVTDTPDGKNRRVHYSSVKQALSQDDIGKWVHLAVVYDSDRKSVDHYVDGEILASKEIEIHQPVSIGVADLGNWPYKEWAKGTRFETRNIEGTMDEFIAFSRALSRSEIRQIYESGRP